MMTLTNWAIDSLTEVQVYVPREGNSEPGSINVEPNFPLISDIL